MYLRDLDTSPKVTLRRAYTEEYPSEQLPRCFRMNEVPVAQGVCHDVGIRENSGFVVPVGDKTTHGRDEYPCTCLVEEMCGKDCFLGAVSRAERGRRECGGGSGCVRWVPLRCKAITEVTTSWTRGWWVPVDNIGMPGLASVPASLSRASWPRQLEAPAPAPAPTLTNDNPYQRMRAYQVLLSIPVPYVTSSLLSSCLRNITQYHASFNRPISTLITSISI
ncbi:hypothetical protein BU25DRAFT_422638 [Macroventuria anomochaeta]|uniref:Uncharacterized protein n=1 Tax=Macroventuria anomochaeta TaxID=301207 RepID=A0ACB6RZA3_9PLEO|nr:uncharacterized protein BU25DRAFT_422638 [Macroventuria anomochaeta]KAF2626489.1 hypothetical protein BU25DRAFT_422638 [Macroventuria anomochaeta]